MEANARPPTAKIIQFRAKTSFRQPVLPFRAAAGDSAARLAPLIPVEAGGGWYHEAAIQAERPRKS